MKSRENTTVLKNNPELLHSIEHNLISTRQIPRHHDIEDFKYSAFAAFLRDLWEVGGLTTALLIIFGVAYWVAQGI